MSDSTKQPKGRHRRKAEGLQTKDPRQAVAHGHPPVLFLSRRISPEHTQSPVTGELFE